MNHKRWQFLSIFFLVGFIVTVTFNSYKVVGKSEMEVLKKEGISLKESGFQKIQVPNSDYTLILTFDPNPNEIHILKEEKGLLKRKGFVYAHRFNLYTIPSNNKWDNLIDEKYQYGFKKVGENQHIYLDGEDVHTFPIGEYFKGTKFESVFSELHFWYIDKPVADRGQLLRVE